MCVPYSCLRCRCLYQWTRTANHLMQSCSAWHHREYRVLLFHHEIDQRSAAALSRFANRRRDLISTARRDSKKSEGLSEFGEIKSRRRLDRKSTRLNSSHSQISYAVFCLKKKTQINR